MNEQIDIIIAKKLSGEASEEELHILEAWLAEDEMNRSEYDRVAQLWSDADGLFTDVHFNTEAAWNNVSAKTIAQPVQRKTISFPAWGKYALAAAAILLLGIFLLKPFAGNDTMTVAFADAGNKDVVLPDNSHVTLRKGSKLSYPASFASATRNVTLEGEAFFEVTRNEQKPFVISAQSVSVKVLGTSFNVKCDASSAKVSVATGKVQMTMLKDTTQYVILTKGIYGELANSHLTQSTSTDDNYMFWKTGALHYENRSLAYIANDIASNYQKQIAIDSTARQGMASQLINISFKDQPIDKVLEELCLVAQCRWTLKDGNYIISPK